VLTWLKICSRSGGGSTFGVVTSVVVKAHPDIPVTSITFAFVAESPAPSDLDTFWTGVRAYFNHFIPFSDAGTYGYFWLFPGPVPVFSLQPFFAPNKTAAETEALLSPWIAELASLGITPNLTFNSFPSFLDGWSASFPQEAVGMDTSITGSGLFPRSNWLNETSLNATFDAWKTSVDLGALSLNFNMAPRFAGPGSDTTAVNPTWRETVMHALELTGFAENATRAEIEATRELLTQRQTAWREVSPGAGAYLGEGDREEFDFQQSFYGTKYPQLLEIKRSIDPWDVFWAKTAVASDRWAVRTSDVVNDENGVLCRV
jgi:hypothetical protein